MSGEKINRPYLAYFTAGSRWPVFVPNGKEFKTNAEPSLADMAEKFTNMKTTKLHLKFSARKTERKVLAERKATNLDRR